jgi:hypothetical protein
MAPKDIAPKLFNLDHFKKKNGAERALKQKLDLCGVTHIDSRGASRVYQALAVA